MATSAKKKTNQNTSYTTTSGQKVSIKNGVKTYSGAATPAPKIGSVVNGTKVGYNVGGKSYADSSDAERGNAIDVATIPAKMTPETPANIPTYTIPNFGDITGQNNIGLGAVTSQFGTTYDAKTGQFVTAPTGTQDNFQSLFEQATALGNTAFEEMGTAESRLKKLEKENQLKQKQQAVNETTGQINAIVAQAQAQQLALEGQGRGQTSSFIGGEQARINREAAIQAIPLQAKLAAEQGALELAQEHIDKMFTVQSQDALAKYQYRSKLIESVYNFATGAEQRRLDAIKQKEDRAYDMQKFNIQYQRDLASQAAEYGLGGVASSILKANPLSPTFEADIARYASQVVKPVVATGFKAPEVKTINGVDMQWNSTTGAWEAIAGGMTGGQDATNLDAKYTALLSDIGTARGLKDQVGAGIIERTAKNLFSGNNKPAQLENITNTIKANLLTLNTDPAIKKFFGPQMSNRDTELMMGAAGTLDPVRQSPVEYEKDLIDAANLIVRAREAVRTGLGQGSLGGVGMGQNIVLTPDGMEVVIID